VHDALLVSILDELVGGRLAPPDLRRVAMSIIGQCFLYRAAGDVVGMLVPREEHETHHALKPLADHVTRYALAALGVAPPLADCASGAVRSIRSIKEPTA